MFTLVVFTLVVGATTSGAFMNALNDVASYGGGFDVRATASPASPVRDIDTALERAGLGGDVRVAASQSTLPVEARQVGDDAKAETYVARGLDEAFLRNTTYGLGAIAAGYESERELWRALAERPGLAIVDPAIVPRRSNFNFGVPPDFQLSGIYVEDERFRPVEIVIRDPQTSRELRLTVIGVLADGVPLDMVGVFTSQTTLVDAFADRVPPTTYLLAAGLDVSTLDIPDMAVAGKTIDTGGEAQAFAGYLRIHALESTGGQVYAEMGRFLDGEGNPTNDEAAAAKDPETGAPVANQARNLWVTATALSTALNTAFFAERVGLFSIAIGGALLLVGVGFYGPRAPVRIDPEDLEAASSFPLSFERIGSHSISQTAKGRSAPFRNLR